MKKIILLAFILLLSNTYSLAEKPTYDREVSFVREIFNFHVVAPNVMRGSKPSERALRLLRKYCGVKTVLSLISDKQNNELEKQIVEKLGMTFINIPMDSSKEQDKWQANKNNF